jgi:hypothetical protein
MKVIRIPIPTPTLMNTLATVSKMKESIKKQWKNKSNLQSLPEEFPNL